jgi:hypothetical protein
MPRVRTSCWCRPGRQIAFPVAPAVAPPQITTCSGSRERVASPCHPSPPVRATKQQRLARDPAVAFCLARALEQPTFAITHGVSRAGVGMAPPTGVPISQRPARPRPGGSSFSRVSASLGAGPLIAWARRRSSGTASDRSDKLKTTANVDQLHRRFGAIDHALPPMRPPGFVPTWARRIGREGSPIEPSGSAAMSKTTAKPVRSGAADRDQPAVVRFCLYPITCVYCCK